MVVTEQLKKYKVLISVILVIILALMFFLFNSSSDSNAKEKILEFENAVKQGDAGKLQKLIKPENQEMAVTVEHFKQLVAYAEEHPDYLKEHAMYMEAQAEIINKDYTFRKHNRNLMYKTDEEINTFGDFYIKKTGGLFSSYEIVARPCYLNIEADKPNTTIEMFGKKIFTTSEGKLEYRYGPLMPGKYSIFGTTQIDGEVIKTKEEIEIFDNLNYERVTKISLLSN